MLIWEFWSDLTGYSAGRGGGDSQPQYAARIRPLFVMSGSAPWLTTLGMPGGTVLSAGSHPHDCLGASPLWGSTTITAPKWLWAHHGNHHGMSSGQPTEQEAAVTGSLNGITTLCWVVQVVRSRGHLDEVLELRRGGTKVGGEACVHACIGRLI
jgi:hypothetical protein